MLSTPQVEEALGRAALVFELQEVEARSLSLVDLIEERQGEKAAADSGAELDGGEEARRLELEIEGRQDELDRLVNRARAITDALWGEETEQPPDWRQEIRALDRPGAIRVLEHFLRRYPQVTPPEDVDNLDLAELQAWLLDKIGALPEQERTGWSR